MSRARTLLAALVAVQVAHGRRPAPRPPAETRAILLAMLGVSGIEAAEARGVRAAATAVGVPGAIGFGAEVLGVATGRPFGRYEYSAQLGPRIAGVPLLAAAAWAIMARPAWVAAGWCSPRPALRVPIAAAALTAWDAYLDPRMVEEGYWSWPGGGRYAGVPVSNFAGWFVTGLAAFSAIALVDRGAPSPRDDGALALYAWTWVGEGIANAALWRRPLTAAVGALAMGPVAVPALRRRWRG